MITAVTQRTTTARTTAAGQPFRLWSGVLKSIAASAFLYLVTCWAVGVRPSRIFWISPGLHVTAAANVA